MSLRKYVRGKGCSGQSTVEYAIVFAAFLVIAVVLGMLSNTLEDATLIRHAVSAASHNISAAIGGWSDAFSY